MSLPLGFPHLKKLSSVMRPWNIVQNWIRPTLTHLQIVNSISELPEEVEWSEVLRHLPLLEDLQLVHALLPDTILGSLDDSYCIVELPNLRRLRLVQECNYISACVDLLLCISFPSDASVVVMGRYDKDGPLHLMHPYHQYRELISCLALKKPPHLPNDVAPPSERTCEIFIRQNGYELPTTFNLVIRLGTSTGGNRKLLHLSLLMESKRQEEQLFGLVCSTTLLSGLTSLSVDGLGARPHVWHQLMRLEDTPLAHLCVRSDRTLGALLHVLEQRLMHDSVPSLFARLQRLKVLGDGWLPAAGSGRIQPMSRLQRLSDVLAALRRRGLGPEILDVCNMGLLETDMALQGPHFHFPSRSARPALKLVKGICDVSKTL
jgi:hypothetical protein